MLLGCSCWDAVASRTNLVPCRASVTSAGICCLSRLAHPIGGLPKSSKAPTKPLHPNEGAKKPFPHHKLGEVSCWLTQRVAAGVQIRQGRWLEAAPPFWLSSTSALVRCLPCVGHASWRKKILTSIQMSCFLQKPTGEPSQSTSVGMYLLSPSCWLSGSSFSAPRWCFPQLPSCRYSFCCLPFEGSFARLFRKGTFFHFHCLNKNTNKCEDHQKARNAPEQSAGFSGLQLTPAEEVSGASPPSNKSEYSVV